MPTPLPSPVPGAAGLSADHAGLRSGEPWHWRTESAFPARRAEAAEEAAERSLKRFAAAPGYVSVRGGYGYAIGPTGIATIQLDGPLMPAEDAFWYGGTSYDHVQADVAAIAGDPNVRGVMLQIDSPGGTVAGAYELADALFALAQVKPVAAYGESVVASAAYLQASQASAGISVTRTNVSGSIGTRTYVADAHAMFERNGLKIIPIDSGGMKSAGLFGTEVTAEMIAYFQGLVDAAQKHFVDAVSRGRDVSLAEAGKWADGRVYPAEQAKALGLIDYIEPFDAAMARLAATVNGNAPTQTRTTGGRAAAPSPVSSTSAAVAAESETPVSQSTTAPATGAQNATQATAPGAPAQGATAPHAETPQTKTSASLAQIKSACPGASSDFILEQAEKGASVEEAKDAFIGWQAAQLRGRDEELAKARQPAGAATAAAAPNAESKPESKPEPKAGATSTKGDVKSGVQPSQQSAGEKQAANFDSDPQAELQKRVAALTANGRMSRAAAVGKVFRDDPALHDAINGK